VINGAPMSYWGGAWSEGEGDNPMRYAGGMLGGTWLASMVSDLPFPSYTEMVRPRCSPSSNWTRR